MAGFGGFTDEEIFRLKMQGQGLEAQKKEPIKKASISNAAKRGKPREKLRTRQSNSRSNNTSIVKECATSPSETSCTTNEPAKKEEKIAEEKVVDVKTEVEKPREVEVVMEPDRVKKLELSNIEKMQQKQKEMEKINKKKEKMLQYTIKQRYKKTKKETETLKLVQKELGHLDNLLSVDVQILRDKIDDACRDYDAARKRYEKAEAEFINAKVSLHDKTGTKDQLTEHLCSIIQENEERKAKKLAELMAKLEIVDQDLNAVEALCENEEKEAVKQPKSPTQNVSDVNELTPQTTDPAASNSQQLENQTRLPVMDNRQMETTVKDTSNNNEILHEEHKKAESESVQTKGGDLG